MPRDLPARTDPRTVDPASPPTVDAVVGVGGGSTHYCRRCGHTVGHVDSGRMLAGLVTYLAGHACVAAKAQEATT
ncbi:hypothetical protein HNR23_002317 [Nocardiopsis mwathae]|uniref:Uncharacterized protein n=1 Tax=Nocardiopsis mwathae TaxID=1472723 RepID=A0A7W9YHJ6_9ACTN|nr:hypothetical protein [Nocardiopsis mwathae]MBB6172257.1 hypothetical protein [Nocardiopsis mwathae]